MELIDHTAVVLNDEKKEMETKTNEFVADLTRAYEQEDSVSKDILGGFVLAAQSALSYIDSIEKMLFKAVESLEILCDFAREKGEDPDKIIEDRRLPF